MHNALSYGPVVARILVGGMFIQAGVMKAMNFAGTVAGAESVGIPAATTAVALAVAIEILGGLSVLLGYKIKIGALVLAAFVLVVSYYFHFDFADQVQAGFFIKNMGIVAALLYMASFGAGKFAVRK